jgi:hypothetical protein
MKSSPASASLFLSVLVFVLAILLPAAARSEGSQQLGLNECTPDTCKGPVNRIYDGKGCQAGQAFFYNHVGNAVPSTCAPLLGYFSDSPKVYATWTCDGSYVTINTFSDTECKNLDYIERTAVGQCFSSTRFNTSYAALCNVNDTTPIIPPGQPDTSVPILSAVGKPCPSPNNCTGSAYYTTHYNGDSCYASNVTYSSGIEITANFSLGNCFYDAFDATNVKRICDESFLIEQKFSHGCSGSPPVYEYKYTKSCRRTDSGTSYDYSCPSTRIAVPSHAARFTAPLGSGFLLFLMAFFVGISIFWC